jgi:hypothetical protein
MQICFQPQMQPVHSLLALLFVWLAMDATVAGTNRPSFEVSQRLTAEGFVEVSVDLLKSLSVPHNSVGAITNELKSPPVLDVLTRGLSVEPSRLAAFEALGFEDAQRGNNAISAEIWWKLPEATASEVNVIQGRLKRYVDCRWEGDTAKPHNSPAPSIRSTASRPVIPATTPSAAACGVNSTIRASSRSSGSHNGRCGVPRAIATACPNRSAVFTS